MNLDIKIFLQGKLYFSKKDSIPPYIYIKGQK